MLQVVQQTRKEKIKMYKKMKKRELIEMLLNNQDIVERLTRPPETSSGGTTPWPPNTTTYRWSNNSVQSSYTQ